MIAFDHIAIAGETLQEAQAHVEEALGVRLQAGGQHDVFFTHNMLLGLEDGLYLEAIATNPEAPEPSRPRWFDLDRFAGPPRLTNWICRAENMDETLSQISENMGQPVQLQRGDLRWKMAVPDSGILPFDNVAPALIEWQTTTHPASVLAPSGVVLQRLTLQHPGAADLAEMLAPHLNDDRIAIETGTQGMHVAFATPHGERVLQG